MFEIMEEPSQEAVIKVIGVGGCGGNAVDHMIVNGVKGVEFICANTDMQALKRTKAGVQLQLGQQLTRGLGAGAKPEIGREAAIEDRTRIEDLIRGTDLLFITAGMGKGTGTGAAPVIAEIARELGILTVAVVTRPFDDENRLKNAQEGIEALREHVNSLIIVENEKLMQVLGDTVTQAAAFRAANDVLHGAVAGIAEIIKAPGEINVDFADVRTVMSEAGLAMMGTATAVGTDRGRVAAEQAIACPLLEDVDIADARGILVNISASQETLLLRERKDVLAVVRAFASPSVTLIWGTVYDESLGDALRVTIVATGLGKKAEARMQPQPKMQVVAGTGTDGPMMVDYDELEVPSVIRSNRSRQQVDAMKQSGMDPLEIPAFLRKQAD